MIVARVVESGAGTGERPEVEMGGWQVVDEVDVADLASEAGHDYYVSGRHTIKENVVKRGVAKSGGGIADGGRLVRRHEKFMVRGAPGRSTKLVVRLSPHGKDDLVVTFNSARMRIPIGRRDGFFETAIDIPKSNVRAENRVRVETAGEVHYYSFHYFVMQPKE